MIPNLPVNEVPNGWPDEAGADQQASEPGFDALEAELSELNLLIERGMTFTTPKRSLLRFFSKKTERTWLLKGFYQGTIDRLSAEFIRIDYSEERLRENFFPEVRRLESEHSLRLCRIAAIALINSYWGLKWLTPLLAWYLSWHLTPAVMFQLVVKINSLSNHPGFISSIRFLFVAKRTTTPALMEKPERPLG